jgi:hypothetical protein
MPTISTFFGILIRMYFRDHPPPHFQASYNEFEANIAIQTGEVIDGRLPATASRLVKEMIKVVGFRVLGEYRARVELDGSRGEHDFNSLAVDTGPMLQPFRDPAYFARSFIEAGAPTWPNGFDLSPEWLRREMAAAGELSRPAA